MMIRFLDISKHGVITSQLFIPFYTQTNKKLNQQHFEKNVSPLEKTGVWPVKDSKTFPARTSLSPLSPTQILIHNFWILISFIVFALSKFFFSLVGWNFKQELYISDGTIIKNEIANIRQSKSFFQKYCEHRSSKNLVLANKKWNSRNITQSKPNNKVDQIS